jgi:hypothetical protein
MVPERSANRSIASWVTSRQSLVPIVRPTSALSSSIPLTVIVMARAYRSLHQTHLEEAGGGQVPGAAQ